MGFKVKHVLKSVRLNQIQAIESRIPQQPQTQTSTIVDEPEPQDLNFVDESEPQQQAPSIIDDSLPLEPPSQQKAPSIIDDTLPHASTLAEESEPQPQPQPQHQPQHEASSTTDELQQDLSTLVEFLVRQQDQIEWAQ